MNDLELCKMHVLYLSTPNVVGGRDNRYRQQGRKEKVEGLREEREMNRAYSWTQEHTKQ